MQDGEKYGGTLAVAILSLVKGVKDIFGEIQTIITIYNNCKLMLLDMSPYNILVGLALQRSFNLLLRKQLYIGVENLPPTSNV
jgi:hypothetical protein